MYDITKIPLLHTLIYNSFMGLLVSVTAAEDYAKYVVSQTIRASPPLWIWRGSYAFTTWIAVGALLLAIASFDLTELVDIDLYADWIHGTPEGNGLVINQCHLLKLAKQDAVISQQLGLDIFKKRLAETKTPAAAQNSGS